MKKIIVFMLSIVICLSFTACSSKEPVGEESTEKVEETITKMPEFQTTDMDGNKVTNDIFSKADLTIVNFWGTFCGPCINEMPELAKWDLPEKAQMIGIMVDVDSEDSEEYELAGKIIKQTGVEYTNLLIDPSFDDIYEQITGVPTTYFVDSEGNIVGGPVVGAYVERYQKFVEEYFDEK